MNLNICIQLNPCPFYFHYILTLILLGQIVTGNMLFMHVILGCDIYENMSYVGHRKINITEVD